MGDYGITIYDETGLKIFDNTVLACRLATGYPTALQPVSSPVPLPTSYGGRRFGAIILSAYNLSGSYTHWFAWDYAGYVNNAYISGNSIIIANDTTPTSSWRANHTAPTLTAGTTMPSAYYDNTITGTTYDTNPQPGGSSFVFLFVIG